MLNTTSIELIKLRDKAIIPCRQHNGDAGFDLYACLDAPVSIYANYSEAIPTGIAIHLRYSHLCGMVFPRSGLGTKSGIILPHCVGVIDSNYQGELMIHLTMRPLANREQGYKPFQINHGDRIAQLVIVNIEPVIFEEKSKFAYKSDRSTNGFGSTGI